MIRADIIKTYKTVHTWIGITCGFALFIAFYAGALTMFKEPIARWASPPAVGVAAVSLDDAGRLIELVAAEYPLARKEGITLHLRGHENEPARVTWKEELPHDESDPNHHHEHVHWWATLKPDGTLLAEQEEPSELAQFIDDIHRRVGIPQPWGAYFIGVVSLLYGVALISGVIVLLPSLAKDFFAMRVGKNLKRMWLDAHNVVGITGLPFHIVMAVTAIAFSIGGPIFGTLDSVAYGGRQKIAMQRFIAQLQASAEPTGDTALMLSPPQLLQKAKAKLPEFEPHAMIFEYPGDRAATVRITGTEPGYIGDTKFGGVILSAVTGDVVNDGLRPSRQDSWWRATRTIFSLHTGEYGGATIKWAYFFLGFSGAWLFYGGNLLWIETRRKKARKDGEVEQSRSTRLLGSATVGVCLGCVAGLSLTIVAAKWLHGRVGDLNHWHEVIYYAVFFASIAWAFAWGAARAAVHLLWLCVAATITIPVTTLVALLFPALGMWAHGSAATIGVDVVAFIGALCFAWMAIATARRIRNGSSDSIWSVRKAEDRTAAREAVAIAAE